MIIDHILDFILADGCGIGVHMSIRIFMYVNVNNIYKKQTLKVGVQFL